MNKLDSLNIEIEIFIPLNIKNAELYKDYN